MSYAGETYYIILSSEGGRQIVYIRCVCVCVCVCVYSCMFDVALSSANGTGRKTHILILSDDDNRVTVNIRCVFIVAALMVCTVLLTLICVYYVWHPRQTAILSVMNGCMYNVCVCVCCVSVCCVSVFSWYIASGIGRKNACCGFLWRWQQSDCVHHKCASRCTFGVTCSVADSSAPVQCVLRLTSTEGSSSYSSAAPGLMRVTAARLCTVDVNGSRRSASGPTGSILTLTCGADSRFKPTSANSQLMPRQSLTLNRRWVHGMYCTQIGDNCNDEAW